MSMVISLIKWIFGLHQLVWFVVGAGSFSAITYFYFKLKEKGTFGKGRFTFVILSALTAAFAVLWTFDSYIENEIRAANMGILVFGGLAVIFALVAHKMKAKVQVETKES